TEAKTKLARAAGLTLDLVPTPDVLAEVARRASGLDLDGTRTRPALDPRPVLVGFAAETGSLERAADKLARKGVDFLVANDVAEAGSGFGTETNRVTLLFRGGMSEALPLLPKREVAERILDRVRALLDVRDRSPQTGSVPGRPSGAGRGGVGAMDEGR
ncbi:MAG: phosphopantothenoylcysteine decarboxylase, partial [Chloroflexota bacterium]